MDDQELSLTGDEAVIDGAEWVAGLADEADDADDGDDDVSDDADDADDAEDDEGDEDEDEDEDEDDDALAAREAELAAREAQIQDWQRRQAQAQAERYWSDKWAEGEAYFARSEQELYAQAEAVNAYDRDEFLRPRLQALRNQQARWVAEYYGAQQGALYRHLERQAVPLYAQEVARYYGLPAGDAERLLRVGERSGPDAMVPYAEELRALRRAQKRAAAAERLPRARPGGGRGAGPRVKKGSDEHLVALLASARR